MTGALDELRHLECGSARLELVEGDLTEQATDAIVNAANASLLGGGGVDGAIHRAGGPEILAACRELGGCATGDAKLTHGGRLPARYVIHAVGPIYQGGSRGEASLLASVYRRSLAIAAEHRLRSIAFPSISTGAYGYPIAEAATIALAEVAGGLATHPSLALARFVLFSPADARVYARALAGVARQVLR